MSAEVVLAVRDVLASIRFYRDVVGFESDWVWGEDARFGGVTWGNVHVMLQQSPDGPFGTTFYCGVRDLNAIYERHLTAGIVTAPIEDKPWGKREYMIRDPDGHRLRIAGRIPSMTEPSKEFPKTISIEERVLSREDFDRLRKSVDWAPSKSTETLENTWKGVVALYEGEVVGTVRITRDSEGWFGIWDVIVAPEWQGRRVGEAMMNRAMDLVRSKSPGAFVFLFTFRNEFYEKLGFRAMEAMARNV